MVVPGGFPKLILLVALVALCLVMPGCGPRNSPADVHLKRASSQLVHHKPARAWAAINAAIQSDPSKSDTYRRAVSICIDHKRPADAARVTQLLLDRAQSGKLDEPFATNDQVDVLFLLGQLKQEAKDLNGVEEAYSKALALAPDNPQAMNALAYFYAENDLKLPEALRLARRAVTAMPESGAIVDTLGWVEHKLGRSADAARTLRRAVELMPDDATLRYHLGAAYARQGQPERARIELKKALMLDHGVNDAATLLRDIHK